MRSDLRQPQTAAEHAALRAHCNRVGAEAKSILPTFSRKHRLDRRTPWRGFIFEGPSGPEPVVIISLWLDPSAEPVVADEKRAAQALQQVFINACFYVGGVPCEPNEVWVRGSAIKKAA